MRCFIISLMFVAFVWGEDVTERNKKERLSELMKKRGPPAGNSGKEAKPLIVGGNPARRGEYPWMVSLHYNGVFICGGSIYNADTIITLTACVIEDAKQKYGKFVIKAGDHNLKKNESTEQEVSVMAIVTHPRFKWTKFGNDIAVLKLEESLVMNKFVQSIEIPTSWKEELLTKRDQCVLTGWGWDSFPDGSNTRVLNEVEAPIYDRDNCTQYLGDFGVRLSNRQLCTLNPGKGACLNDGGAALVCFDKTNKPFFVGGIEFIADDCWSGFGVHTRIARYRKWIVEVLK